MIAWEYKVIRYDTGKLNELGAECWELVAVTDTHFFFKRNALSVREAAMTVKPHKHAAQKQAVHAH